MENYYPNEQTQEPQLLSRRQFLRNTGIAVVGGAIASILPMSVANADSSTNNLESASEKPKNPAVTQFYKFLNSQDEEFRNEHERFGPKAVNILRAFNEKELLTDIQSGQLLNHVLNEFRRSESEMVGTKNEKPVQRPISYQPAARTFFNLLATKGKTTNSENGALVEKKFIVTVNGNKAVREKLGLNTDDFFSQLNDYYLNAKAFDPSESGYYAFVDPTKVLESEMSSEQKYTYEVWQTLNGHPSTDVTIMDNTNPNFDPHKIQPGYAPEGFNPKTIFTDDCFNQRGFDQFGNPY